MTRTIPEIRAIDMWPGTYFRHDGQVCRASRVAFTPRADGAFDIEITADVIVDQDTRGATTLRRLSNDPLRLINAPNTPAAQQAPQPELLNA